MHYAMAHTDLWSSVYVILHNIGHRSHADYPSGYDVDIDLCRTNHGSIASIALGAHWLLRNRLLYLSCVAHIGLSACSSEELYQTMAKAFIGY